MAFALLPVLLIAGLGISFFSYRYFDRERKKSLAQPPLAAAVLKFEQITNSGNVVSATISRMGSRSHTLWKTVDSRASGLSSLLRRWRCKLFPQPIPFIVRYPFHMAATTFISLGMPEAQSDDLYRIPALGGPSTKSIPSVHAGRSRFPQMTAMLLFARRLH